MDVMVDSVGVGSTVTACVVETTPSGSMIVRFKQELYRVLFSSEALTPGQKIALKVTAVDPLELTVENHHLGYSEL